MAVADQSDSPREAGWTGSCLRNQTVEQNTRVILGQSFFFVLPWGGGPVRGAYRRGICRDSTWRRKPMCQNVLKIDTGT